MSQFVEDLEVTGLSPRVRGNQWFKQDYETVSGSIPACAGEPTPGRFLRRQPRVYPRVCGGTMSQISQTSAYRGLSPRVRGNHFVDRKHEPVVGSIPACAGEPRTGTRWRRLNWVYPRVCGGTDMKYIDPYRLQGLSPRVRAADSKELKLRLLAEKQLLHPPRQPHVRSEKAEKADIYLTRNGESWREILAEKQRQDRKRRRDCVSVADIEVTA